MQKQKFPDRIIFILSLFVSKALSRKEQVVTVFSNGHIVDRISLCSVVFHKVEIVLSYIESEQNPDQNPERFPAYNQFHIRNDTLLLFCYGIFGPSKYVCLNF